MNDLHLGNFILALIQTVVFMTPVLVLFYKQGRKDQVLEEAVRDINGLGSKVAEVRDSQAQTLSELKSKIENMNNTLIKVTTVMEVIKSDIERIKNKKRN